MTHYETLGIPPSATQAEITAAYRRKAKATHPDHGGSAKEFQRVEAAGRVLRDIAARQKYDATGDDGLGSQEKTREQKIVELLFAAGDGIPAKLGPKARLRKIQENLGQALRTSATEKKSTEAEIADLEAQAGYFTIPEGEEDVMEALRQKALNDARGKLVMILDIWETLLGCTAYLKQIGLTNKGAEAAAKEAEADMVRKPTLSDLMNGATHTFGGWR